MAGQAARPARRALPGLALVLLALAGCGGGDGAQSDVDAIASTLKSAASAVADGDGEKACGHLTADGQRQAQLQFGGGIPLGSVECGTFVNRATAFLTPLDKARIRSLEPANVRTDGSSASATLATSAGAPQPMSVELNLQKTDDGWKISGFSNAQGVPGG